MSNNISSHGYVSYPKVPANTEFPNAGAPEKLFAERTGDDESWKGGPAGLQPGFDLPGISPMAGDLSMVAGPVGH